jgi:glutaredoxin 3
MNRRRHQEFNHPSIVAMLMLAIMSIISGGSFGVQQVWPVAAAQHAEAPTIERYLSTGQRPTDRVQMFIDESEVMVFAKSYCPYCKRTRSLFDRIMKDNAEMDIFVNILDLDTLPEEDGRLMQNALLELTGQRTVPNVFVAGVHVGGNAETQALSKTGKLMEALEEMASSREL